MLLFELFAGYMLYAYWTWWFQAYVVLLSILPVYNSVN